MTIDTQKLNHLIGKAIPDMLEAGSNGEALYSHFLYVAPCKVEYADFGLFFKSYNKGHLIALVKDDAVHIRETSRFVSQVKEWAEGNGYAVYTFNRDGFGRGFTDKIFDVFWIDQYFGRDEVDDMHELTRVYYQAIDSIDLEVDELSNFRKVFSVDTQAQTS